MGGEDTSTNGGAEKVADPILEDTDLTRSGKPPRMAGERAGSIDTAVVGARRAGAQDGRQEGPAESSTFDRAHFFPARRAYLQLHLFLTDAQGTRDMMACVTNAHEGGGTSGLLRPKVTRCAKSANASSGIAQ